MYALRESMWGPRPLPQFLTEQLARHGLSPRSSATCASLIRDHRFTAAAASLFVDLGSCKFLEGDIDGAIAAWRHALSSVHDAAAARALLNMGLLYEHLHLYERAVGVLASVAERGVRPYVTPAALASARCQRAMGEPAQAMETMARVAQHAMARDRSTPELAETLLALGEVAVAAGRPDRAVRAWRAASAAPICPAQRSATQQLVELLLEQGHDDDVIEILERSSAGELDDAAPLLERADALHRLGQIEQASAIANSIGGGLSAPDRFRLAELKLQLGLVNEAIDEFELLLSDETVEVNQRAAFSLGELYREYDMADAATSMYQQVIDQADQYWTPKACLSLGDSFDEQGDHDRAVALWTQAASSDMAAVARLARDRLRVEPAPSGPENAPLSAHAQPPAGAVETGAESPSTLSDQADDAEPAFVDSVEVDSFEPEPAARSIEVVSLDALDPAAGDELAVTDPIDLVDEPEVLDDLVSNDAASTDSASQERDESDETFADGVDDVDELESDALVGEPVVVSLDDFEKSTSGSEPEQSADLATEPAHGPGPSPFASLLGDEPELLPASADANPYAALAADTQLGDVAPSQRNPYAELAPNFGDDFEPASDVEPGDWESMLDVWPKAEPDPETTKPAKKRSSAFSRYT